MLRKALSNKMLSKNVAILYQAVSPPSIDGQRKVAKEGGYSDSGADIGYALSTHGVSVVTPVSNPQSTKPFDWVFPDTSEGIAKALDAGADLLFVNTNVFHGHPIEAFLGKVPVVGQHPDDVHKGDNKFGTNASLLKLGLPIARSWLIGNTDRAEIRLGTPSAVLDSLNWPVIIKPVRGRGSQGVTLVPTRDDLVPKANVLLDSAKYGDMLILEEYLPGNEITITVMPPKAPRVDGTTTEKHWAFRPVKRADQVDGVMPYNGVVPVSANSEAVSDAELKAPELQKAVAACCQVGDILHTRGVLRIDCRQDPNGTYKIFDINMKPNMTGPGRPGRDNQESLCGIAARGDGVSYSDLLKRMLASAWTN